MTTLSTHDTKRGEDVRARLAVLAELPGRWAEQVAGWMAAAPLPDPAFAHLLWQTAVGAWPIERERLHAYAEKAAREAGGRDQLGRPRRGVRARPCTPWSTGCTTTRACTTSVDRARRRDHPVRLVQLARPEAGAAHHARRPRHLPGHRAVGQLPGRPGQPPPGRLRRTPRAAGPPRRRLACRRSTPTGRRSCSWSRRALRLRRDRPELFSGYRPVPVAGPGGRARGRLRPGRRDHRGHPAAAAAWPAPAAGTTRGPQAPRRRLDGRR